MYEFNTQVLEVSFIDLNKHLNIAESIDVDIDYKDMYAKWTLDIEMRDWGVKSMITSIKYIYGEITFSVFSDLEDGEKEQLRKAGFTENHDGSFYLRENFHTEKEKWNYWDGIEITSDTIAPTEIEINYKTKKISVQ